MRLERRAKDGVGGGHRRRRKRWMVAAVLGALVVGGGVGAWQLTGALTAAPQPAPRFNLMASTGRVITLDDFLGKQEVVLIFYMGAG
jgi:hypothetical protein